MAATQDEILKGLAEILSESAGIPNDDVQLDKSFTDNRITSHDLRRNRES
jgi:acyl carrier protein